MRRDAGEAAGGMALEAVGLLDAAEKAGGVGCQVVSVFHARDADRGRGALKAPIQRGQTVDTVPAIKVVFLHAVNAKRTILARNTASFDSNAELACTCTKVILI